MAFERFEEKSVLVLWKNGHSTKEIANLLELEEYEVQKFLILRGITVE